MNWLSPALSWAGAALSCFAWWRIGRALKPFLAGPVDAASFADMADAPAERQAGERRRRSF